MPDELTDVELSELKLLIKNEEEITQFALKRTDDKTLKGMYMSLWKKEYLQGVSYANNEFYVKCLNPSAYWAVEKARSEKEQKLKELKEKEKQRREDRKHDRINMFIGWIGGVISALIVSLITGYALLNGVPMG